MQTIQDAQRALQSGATSARALTERCLAAVKSESGEGPRTFLKVNEAAALARADEIDALRRRGAELPPFAGIPISIKDLFDVQGEVTTAGSVVLKNAAPASADAAAVARLRAAGFIMIGRTNMTEFAYSGVGLNSHYGTPKKSLRAVARAHPRRIILGRGHFGDRRNGLRWTGHRYRRFVPNSGSADRPCRMETDGRACVVRRRIAVVAVTGFRRLACTQRFLLRDP